MPFASLSPEVAARTISLFAPTKAYNFAGLGGAVAVIPDPGLRERFEAAAKGIASNVSPLAFAALGAAFGDQSGFLATQNRFLAANGAILEDAVAGIEGIAATHVEGTFLAWLDVTALALPNPAACFEAHGLGLSDGEDFGTPRLPALQLRLPALAARQGHRTAGQRRSRPGAAWRLRPGG